MPRLTRDGVALAYEETGHGEPPLLFVHGWACDHTFFAPQVEHFSPRHRAIAVDLRGHGASDRPKQDYTLTGFADDLAWLCEQLGVQQPVVVGHSMGASTALQLAARHPSLPRALVLVDGGTRSLADPPPSGDPLPEMVERLRGAEPQAAARQFIDQMFLPTDDPGRRAWITDRMLATPPHVMASALEGISAADSAAAAAACKVPLLYIQAATPRPELERFRKLCPQLVAGRTVGAGHFNQLEVPDQVNAMIERFLTIIQQSPPATG